MKPGWADGARKRVTSRHHQPITSVLISAGNNNLRCASAFRNSHELIYAALPSDEVDNRSSKYRHRAAKKLRLLRLLTESVKQHPDHLALDVVQGLASFLLRFPFFITLCLLTVIPSLFLSMFSFSFYM